ncbi:ABC transporter permease [Candidatus Bathyarchaeota archaeon]|nr:ABC transporter permease [Candidatus Bathyarchaeota archaeon]MBS7612980.1 ABC transporter permease [Candidatus Bathyarchaeota archaeon]MBS7618091.1 ABC transporter permease [Candidatus Bathyarchaeota archaeon]
MGKFRKWTLMIPILLLLVVWETVARTNVMPSYLFPPFSRVIVTAYLLIANGVLLTHFLSSLIRVLVGFFLGSLTGITVGILMGCHDALNEALQPILSLLMPIPALDWLPLLMLWIGIGEALPITIIFICSFFPVLYNTATGIRGVPKEYIRVARTLGASREEVLKTILLPLALPSILTGLRLEAGMAWRVIIAAEMIAIPIGIGALLMASESLLRVDIIMVCLMVLAVMCFLFEKVFLLLERRYTKWR